MAYQHAVAILLAEFPQAVARDALVGLEQLHVEQPAVLALGQVEPREAERETGEVSGARVPFAQIGEIEGRGMKQVEARECAVEVVKGQDLSFAAGAASRSGRVN